MCAKPSEWITSVGTSHVGYSHGGREKRKKIISYTAQWINNNSSSPAGRVSKKGRDIKNMKRQCACTHHKYYYCTTTVVQKQEGVKGMQERENKFDWSTHTHTLRKASYQNALRLQISLLLCSNQ